MSGLGQVGRRPRRAILAASMVLWAGAMVATHLPPSQLPRLHVSDRVAHAAGFFVLTGAFWVTLWAYGVRAWPRPVALLLAAAAYAALDEITQPIVGRFAAVEDWTADVLGAAAAVLVCEAVLAALAAQLRRARRRE